MATEQEVRDIKPGQRTEVTKLLLWGTTETEEGEIELPVLKGSVLIFEEKTEDGRYRFKVEYALMWDVIDLTEEQVRNHLVFIA